MFLDESVFDDKDDGPRSTGSSRVEFSSGRYGARSSTGSRPNTTSSISSQPPQFLSGDNDNDSDDDLRRNPNAGYGSSGNVGTPASSRARMLAQQRDLQMKKRNSSLQNEGMVRSSIENMSISNDIYGHQGKNSQFTPAVRQFSAPKTIRDTSADTFDNSSEFSQTNRKPQQNNNNRDRPFDDRNDDRRYGGYREERDRDRERDRDGKFSPRAGVGSGSGSGAGAGSGGGRNGGLDDYSDEDLRDRRDNYDRDRRDNYDRDRRDGRDRDGARDSGRDRDDYRRNDYPRREESDNRRRRDDYDDYDRDADRDRDRNRGRDDENYRGRNNTDPRDNRGGYRDDDNRRNGKQNSYDDSNRSNYNQNNNGYEDNRSTNKKWESASGAGANGRDDRYRQDNSSENNGISKQYYSNDSNNRNGAAAASAETTAVATPVATAVPRAVLNITNMKEFLVTPIPKSAGIVQCYIRRNKSGTNKLFPIYTLYLKDGDRFLMGSKKRPNNKTSNYLITMDESDLSKESSGYLGKLRSNFVGTEFQLFDNGANPKDMTDRFSESTAVRKELAGIMYAANVLGSRGPRKMQVAIPGLNEQDRPVTLRPNVSANGIQGSGDDLICRMKDRNLRELTYLINKPPRWNEQVGAYVLNFNGRVTMASVKNFQLVDPDEQNSIVLQFGRVDKDEFTMDMQYPISPLQAFGITLSSFDSKIACD